MSKIAWKLSFFVVLMSLSSVSISDIGDGQWFLGQCSQDTISKFEKESKDKAQSQLAFCSAFVMGILHGHLATRATYKQPPLFCSPPNRSYFELLGDVVGIVQSQPDKQRAFTSALAIQGLSQLYPCKN